MSGTTEGGKKSSMGGRGDPNKASPAAVEHYLKGIHYPASKGDLVEQARSNDAPDDVMHVLDQFEDKEYESTIDVTKEIGSL